nr:MAG TPA: hypothetical protein [Caudoviricetes sp.]
MIDAAKLVILLIYPMIYPEYSYIFLKILFFVPL